MVRRLMAACNGGRDSCRCEQREQVEQLEARLQSRSSSLNRVQFPCIICKTSNYTIRFSHKMPFLRVSVPERYCEVV